MNARNSQRPHVIKFVVAGVCLSAAVLLGITAQFRTIGRTQTLQAYFYDMSTGRVFAENSDMYAPIVAPSGDTYQGRPGGARAYIFTCDECGDYEGMTTSDIDAAGGFIGYIEIYTEQAIQGLSGSQGSSRVVREMILRQSGGRLVQQVDDDAWVLADSLAGREVQDLAGVCGSKRVKPCRP